MNIFENGLAVRSNAAIDTRSAGDGRFVDSTARRSFGATLAAALDDAASSINHADALAGEVALGRGNVVDAAVARAKADVLLEIVSVAASRVSGALNNLLQTQV